MSKIFISHSFKDKELVHKIVTGLQHAGHQIIYVDGSIQIGESISNRLITSLREADVIIAVITKESHESNWVATEISTAFGYFLERGSPRIIPILFDGVPIPDALSNIQVLFASSNNINEVINKLLITLKNFEGQKIAKEDQIKEIKDKLEKSAESYIEKSLEELRKRESNNKKISYVCYILAYLTLLCSIIFTFVKASFCLNNTNLKIESQIQIGLSSILIITLIVALSRFAFILGKSFMVESLRNADRIHAISFGEFYLKAFGEKAKWEEVKEAFQNWNIDKGSSFITQSANEYDPEFIKNAIELARAISGKNKAS